MTIQELDMFIENENLDKYLTFYSGTIYHGENCLSYAKSEDGLYEVLAMAERGKEVFHYKTLSENEVCKIVLEYLREAKFLHDRAKQRRM